MINFNFRSGAILFIAYFLSMSQLIHAAPDVVAQNYAAANSPGIQSCTAGYDLMSGDVAYQQPLISSKLAYSLNYKAPLRLNLSAAQTFAQPENTTSGWSDNYQSSIIIQNIDTKTTQYTSYSTTINPINTNYFILKTSNPITTELSAKLIIARLPGETIDTVFKEEKGGFSRLYSADAIRDMNRYSINQLSWNTDLGEYELNRINGNLVITKNGVKYTISSDNYRTAPATSSFNNLNLYIDRFGNMSTTTGSWPSGLSGSRSNTAPYLETTSTVSLDLYRVARIESQGRSLDMQYDGLMNLTQVTDNFNNKLMIEHTFDDPNIGSGQTIDESRLVTKVSYADAGQEVTQVAEFKYESYDVKTPSTGITAKVYALIESNSTAAGQTTYVNALTELGAMKAYVASKGRTADSSYYYPVLKQVKNSLSQIVRQWDVTQNYVLGSGNTYSTAQTTLRSFTPDNGTVADNTTVYDDISKSINLNFALDGVSGATTIVQTTINSDKSITLTNTGYPCLTSNKKPLTSATFDTARSRLIQVRDVNASNTVYTYDSRNRLTSTTEAADTPLSRLTTYVYGLLADGQPNPYSTPETIQTSNLKITNILNNRGQIITQTESSTQAGSTSKVTNYSYYEANFIGLGLLVNVDGPRDKITYAYDAYGNVANISKVVSGISRITQYVGFNSFGQPERIVSPNGMVEKLVYNVDGTVKSKTVGTGGASGTVTGQTITYGYNDLKQMISQTSPDGEVVTYQYDVAGRRIQSVLPDDTIEKYTYHPIGTQESYKRTDSAGNVFSAIYQDLNFQGRTYRIRQSTDAGQYMSTYGYDNNGNLIQATNTLGITEKWTYDLLNRIKTHTDGNGNTDTKDYDTNDNVISAKDALNAGSAPLTYRNGNVLVQENNTDFGQKTYTYNNADQLTRRLHGTRQCDYNNIDEIGRYTNFACKASSGSTDTEHQVNDSYTYDQSRYGRLDKVTTSTGYDIETSYSYDSYDRITKKTQLNYFYNTGQALSVGYSYSTAGRLTSTTLPSGRVINYGLNLSKGQVTSISVSGTVINRLISYNGGGDLAGLSWGASGNASQKINYDSIGNISSISNSNTAGNINYSLAYGRDSEGRITSLTRHDGTRDAFTYDNVDRLLTEKRTNGSTSVYGITYTYDRNGNRTSLRATGNHLQPATNADSTYNNNRLNSYSKDGNAQYLSYTPMGDLAYGTYGGGSYDNGGRRKIEHGTVDYYYMNYNHKNERSLRTSPTHGVQATAVQYVYDESSHLIGEYNASGVIVEYVWLGDKPVAAIYGSGAATKIYYIVTDHLNTPRRLIDSSTSAVVWSWDSTAFGLGDPVEAGSIKFNLRFPGQYYDKESKRFYNHNRYYNPELGRYMEPDPIGLEGGLNPYAYAGSNPVMNSDPSGLDFTTGFGGLLTETYNWVLGNGFDWQNLKGAFQDGYNGEGSFHSLYANMAWSAGNDLLNFGTLGLGGAAKNSIVLGAKQADNVISATRTVLPEMEWSTRVGRWMSTNELKAMQSTKMVQESVTGTTHVASPASANAFMRQAKPGSTYVEFTIPSSSLKITNPAEGWGKILGPNSMEGRLALRKGEPVPQMPRASCISPIMCKLN